jgi:tRNA(Ile)-lysidine synthase
MAVGRADTAAIARRDKRSVEDAARRLRYDFLARAADELGADVIATGHTRDDQAETFLLRLIRGAGSRGLGGIRPRAGRIVRPLLEIGRDELRRYVAAHGLSFREDASNLDVTIARNRIRHELLPLLVAHSPGIVRVLARNASLAAADEAYLEQAAIDLAGSIVLRHESGAEVDAEALGALPPVLGSRVARLALETVAAGRFIGFQHIQRFLAIAAGPDAPAVAFPGQRVARRGGKVVLETVRQPFSNSLRFLLSIPGEVAFGAWALTAFPGGEAEAHPLPPARGEAAVVAASGLRLPLAVRTRRRGDRFRPLGMGGRGRKLQDFLVDRKVARAERDRLPLVVDRDDRIVWVVGQSIAEDFRVTAPQRGVILLKARRLGGVG